MESTKNRWLRDADFEKDMDEVSDFRNSSTSSEKQFVKPNVHVRLARSKPSIYEEIYDNDDNVSRPKAKGRGSSLLWQDPYPGGVPSFLRRQTETSKEIRMASTNGFGYCNDQIERMISGIVGNTDILPMDTVKLNASPSKSKTTSVVRSEEGAVNSNNNPPPALYDIIKRNAPKLNPNKNNAEKSVDINSYKDFPKL